VVKFFQDTLKVLKKIIRAPLIHMLILGGLLFGVFLLLYKDKEDSEKIITIRNSDVTQLIARWNAQFKRNPTEQELRAMLNNHIREEVLYREAKTLGLDRDDVIIRRRLAQKMEFLFQDLLADADPTEEELASFFERNMDIYQIPARVTFSHVYFNTEIRTPEEARVRAVLVRDELNVSPETSEGAAEKGDYLMLPYDYSALSREEVSNLFGNTAFTDSLFQDEVGTWQGPEFSAYGLHLYYVQQRSDARVPDLMEVRERVLEDLLHERRVQANELLFEEFRGQYVIEYENDVKAILNIGNTDQDR
jgi:hypothetical protein